MDDFKKANSLAIDAVLVDHGVELSGSGDNLQGLSPFRSSTNKSSFSVCISRNTFKDWKLDYGGGPVKFIMKLLDVDRDEAVRYLIDRYWHGKTTKAAKTYKAPPKGETKKLDPEELDKAYRIFLDMCKLTDEDARYLKGERHLSQEEIETFGLKSFPLRTIRQELHSRLRVAGIAVENVPGLFQYVDDETVTFSRYVGVLIPIKDEFDRVVGLQIRKRKLKSETDNRYVWFSSSFAQNNPDKKAEYKFPGRGPESPLGFVPGTFNDGSIKTVFITEGFFKALAIRDYLRSPAITVQGVTNWKRLPALLAELKKKYPKLNRVIFALDADFISNLNVSTQMCKMYHAIMEKHSDLDMFAMLWSEEDGKGIDDLLTNVGKEGVAQHMTLMGMRDFNSAYEQFLPIGKKMLQDGASDEDFSNKYKEFLVY